MTFSRDPHAPPPAISPLHSKELKISQGCHLGEERAEATVSQRRTLSPRKRFPTVLIICQAVRPPCRRARSPDRWVKISAGLTGPHLDELSYAHTRSPYLHSKAGLRSGEVSLFLFSAWVTLNNCFLLFNLHPDGQRCLYKIFHNFILNIQNKKWCTHL